MPFPITLANTFLCLLLLAGAGCRSIGPSTVKRDRLHYSSAVGDSCKEQLLLNIVKTRYGDSPAFLQVSSLVAGYTLETGLGAHGQYSPASLRGDTFMGGEISGKFTDRPTISYMPLTGEKFTRTLMSPVPLEFLWSVIQGGSPVDFLLGLTLQSMEGYNNMGIFAGQFFPMDSEFAQLLQLLGILQRAHATDSRLIEGHDETEIWFQFRSADSTRTNLAPEMAQLKQLLGVPRETNQVKVVFDRLSHEPGVVGMRTRSLMQILSTLGAGVQIPSEDLAAGGVVRVDGAQFAHTFTVHSGKEKPKQPFVSVPYRGHWFWIEEKDLPTKTTLAAVAILFNFLEAGGAKDAPVLTIPTN